MDLTIKKGRTSHARDGKRGRFCLVICLMLLTIFTAFPAVGAKAAPEPGYTNPDSGYDAYIVDDADLLSASEENQLIETMKPITEYGHVMFLSVADNPYTTSQPYAENTFRQYFGKESGTILLIDMDNRTIWIFSDGAIYRTVTRSYANTITDNIYTYASDGDYYGCAKSAFEQEARILGGGRIAQPMKYISNALLSLVGGVLITFLVLRAQRGSFEGKRNQKKSQTTVQLLGRQLIESHVVTRDSGSRSGGGGGGFSGGGGGGGGHSGGGGGHSF